MRGKTARRLDRAVAALALVPLGALSLAACDHDEKTADSTTTTTVGETLEAYGARLDAECPGEDPGFDVFRGEHPEPTAADWAEFLPMPRESVSETRDCIAASNPPALIAEDMAVVVAAFDVVVDDLDKAISEANAGNLEGTNEWIDQMHDIDQPKVNEAITQVMEHTEELIEAGAG